MAKRLISINLDDDLINEVDAIAESIGMSRSGFVNIVLRGCCMGEEMEKGAELVRIAIAANQKEERENAVLT